MIQIDMPMPEKCSDCIFCDDNCSCVASDYDGFGINVGCAYRTGRRDIRCPLKEQEHEVCENCPYKLEDIGDFSDGYHTFNDLYLQRAVLFATIVNQNLDKAWKSHKHEDGEPCFGGGWFIVAVDTPNGSYSYHYEDKYWNIFKCVELPVAKHWDGHTDKDVWRLLLLT